MDQIYTTTTTTEPLVIVPDERTFLRKLNFTDEMYEFIANDDVVESRSSCSESFHSIGQNYKMVHGYFALIICVFGTVANTLNLIILTQKEMRTPINRMLTALAFVDVLVMIEYVPFALHMYIADIDDREHFSKNWAIFVLFHSHFTQILHTISIQLTLTMAVWRFVVIKFPSKSAVYCTFRRCYLAIAASFIIPIFICIPNYLTFSIYNRHKFYFGPPFGAIFKKEADEAQTLVWFCMILESPDESDDCLETIRERDKYFVDLSDMAKANDGLLHSVHFWTYSVIVKLFPCFILSFFMGYLVKTLYNAKKRHHKLVQGNPPAPHSQNTIGRNFLEVEKSICKELTSDNGALNFPSPGYNRLHPPTSSVTATTPTHNSNEHVEKVENDSGRKQVSAKLGKGSNTRGRSSKRSDRTSKMLMAVLCLFLLTEFPQGIMACLSGLYGQDFFRHCYNSFAEVWDILALVNSAINFILYCFMSKQFRTQFGTVFTIQRCNCFSKHKWTSVSLALNRKERPR